EGGEHLLLRQFSLRVSAGPDKGAVHTSTGERVAVGTHQSNDFVLTDPTMSRFHCEIVISDGRATLRDLESHNGTRVEDVSIEVAHLRNGQTLVLGRTKLRFEIAERNTKVPLAERQ